jgi:hypothetical protein
VTSVASSYASTSLDLLKQQEDIALKAHATSAYFKCFRCFISMLQVFHVDVAYVAMGIHVCWKCIVPNVSSVSDACCKCFIRMLHMFHTYVASVSSLDVAYFTHMLQVFNLDVAYVLQWLYTCFPGVASVSTILDAGCKCFI